jgi:hypothetical protein
LKFDEASADLSASLNFPVTMPVVFVGPQNVTARLGENVTVAVKIFNLTDAYYSTDQPWIPGDEVLGPPGILYNYSLGNLFGLGMMFRWNPDILAYVNHTVKAPVELHPDGVLHEPVLNIVDDVDENAGTYELATTSLGNGTEQFNSPDANATVFTMTFKVIKRGVGNISLDSVDLVTKWDVSSSPHEKRIPNVIRNGWFQTSSLETWIESLKVGFSRDEELWEPIILGENASVRVVVRNDNLTMTETYNLTFYYDGTPLEGGIWTDRVLNPGEAETLNCTIPASFLGRGVHLVNASIAVLHGSEVLTDELTKQFRVVGTPILGVEAPTVAIPGETVTFNASWSTHDDPDGTIQSYWWSLFAPGETLPRAQYQGVSVTHTFAQSAEDGTWSVTLNVTDNFGIEYDPLRPATAPYRMVTSIEIDSGPPSILIAWPKNGSFVGEDVPLSFQISEPPFWIGYSLDYQSNVTISGNTTLPGLPEGVHSVFVYANDTAGSMGASSPVYFTVDASPPNITDVSQYPPESDVQPQDEVTVNATLVDALSGIKQVILNYTTNNGTWHDINMTNLAGNVWTATIPAFPYGTTVTYAVTAEDNAGNKISTSETGYDQYLVVPEFPSLATLLLLGAAALLIAIILRKRATTS